MKCQNYISLYAELDGYIAWSTHNTAFGWKTICAQAVYFLHLTMPSVTACLRLSDASVICRVIYLQFPIKACFSSMSVS